MPGALSNVTIFSVNRNLGTSQLAVSKALASLVCTWKPESRSAPDMLQHRKDKFFFFRLEHVLFVCWVRMRRDGWMLGSLDRHRFFQRHCRTWAVLSWARRRCTNSSTFLLQPQRSAISLVAVDGKQHFLENSSILRMWPPNFIHFHYFHEIWRFRKLKKRQSKRRTSADQAKSLSFSDRWTMARRWRSSTSLQQTWHMLHDNIEAL